MKKMKLAVVFAALVSVFGFSSCLNSDGESSSWDGGDYVTVKEYLGSAYLLTDNGLTLTPTSSSVLSGLMNGTSGYYPRAIVYYKLAEGEIITEGKTSYNISQITGSILPSKEFNANPDTLKADYSITSLEYSSLSNFVWAKNGYINIPFTTRIATNVTTNAFHLYATGVSGDTLLTRFQQDAGGGDNAYQSIGTLISFKLPFNNPLYGQLEPKQDSIVIKVVAKGENNTTLTKTAKYKWSER